MKIYIVILNWNGLSDTITCIDSLKKITYSDYRIVLVDNGSEGNDVEKLQQLYGDYIDVLRNDKNYGFAGGSNIGIKYALAHKADYILLLNNDTTVATNFLTELIKIAISYQNIGIIGPKILDQKTGKLQFVGGNFSFLNLKLAASKIGGGETDYGQYNAPKEREWYTGCCWLVPAYIFTEIGFLNERYFAYCEDIDFSIRVRRKGYKIIYCPQAVIWHKGTASSGGYLSPLSFYLDTRNKISVIIQYGSFLHKLIIIPYIFTAYTFLLIGYSFLYRRLDLLKPFFLALLHHINHREYYHIPNSI